MDRSNKNRPGEQSHNYVPQEIVEEILSHLPVKSLLRFRCVSRSCRSLIGSKNFIDKHLQNSKKRAVIFNNQPSTNVDPWWPIHDPANNHLKVGTIVGCCNGVLCILKEEDRFFLWNPATRISIELPRIDSSFFIWMSGFGFGWDEQSGAHKVFACMPDSHNRSIGKVYSSKTNSWESVDCTSLSECDDVGVFACGKINWITWPGNECIIECFDLKNETFGRMELPRHGGWLRERGGRLHVLYCEEREVWAMEEYGNDESWVRKSNLPILFGGRFNHLICNDEEKITVCYQQYFYAESLISLTG